jgi:hypothetical protein
MHWSNGFKTHRYPIAETLKSGGIVRFPPLGATVCTNLFNTSIIIRNVVISSEPAGVLRARGEEKSYTSCIPTSYS